MVQSRLHTQAIGRFCKRFHPQYPRMLSNKTCQTIRPLVLFQGAPGICLGSLLVGPSPSHYPDADAGHQNWRANAWRRLGHGLSPQKSISSWLSPAVPSGMSGSRCTAGRPGHQQTPRNTPTYQDIPVVTELHDWLAQ